MPQVTPSIDPAQWVEQHGDALFRFALLRVRDPHIAEELVQETFVAALQAQEQFAGRASERTWLIGILKHKIIDHFRRTARERLHDDPEFNGAAEEDYFDSRGRWRIRPGHWAFSPDDVLERKEFWRILRTCLEHLPERLRQAFVLREIDGTESREICKLLEISSTNFWVMMHRARSQLRRCLEIHWFEVEED